MYTEKTNIFTDHQKTKKLSIFNILLNQLINLLNENFESETNHQRTVVAITSAQSALTTTSSPSTSIKTNVNYAPLHKDFYENDDEDIVVVDEEIDLEKAESHDDLSENEGHDDDDDVEYGPKSSKKVSAKSSKKTIAQSTEISLDPDEFNAEVKILEKFKNLFQKEYDFSESSNHALFEKILNLLVTKRINSQIWLKYYCATLIFKKSSCQLTTLNEFYVSSLIQLIYKFTFPEITEWSLQCFFYFLCFKDLLFKKYVNTYNSFHSQILIHSHIIDLLLNILTKLILNETYLSSIESHRHGSGSISRSCSSNLSQNLAQTKTLASLIFERQIHVCFLQLIEVSSELCLVHSSLNILIYIANIDESSDS
ncbi:hypothetical protein BpHYR1_013767 [Brachionus plicatilis]|uniref:Uncharacterized protein n=1 Tax=Brachionus plicatilis TaxID=10195 RepID=A0A3M7RBE4_BRAPC|nr:hypothetical protein BpHYR1_013767 [Brachionus plicatilis]